MNRILIAILLFVFSISTVTLADMAGPAEMLFPGFVSNPNGATYYDTERQNNEYVKVEQGVLPFNTKIIVRYKDDDNFYFCYIDNDDDSRIDYYYIGVDDITLDNFENYLGEPHSATVFEEVKIMDSPFGRFDNEEQIKEHTLGIIPPESKIEVRDYLKHDDWNNYVAYKYVSYNGINGWISTSCCAYLQSGYYSGYVTSKNIETSKGNIIPMLTPIKEYYSFDGEGYFSIVIYYNGEYARLSTDGDIAARLTEVKEYDLLRDGILYEQANFESKILENVIPEGTVLQYDYYTEWNYIDWIHTTYNGLSGWCYVADIEANKDGAPIRDSNMEEIIEEVTTDNKENEYIESDLTEIDIENKANNATIETQVSNEEIIESKTMNVWLLVFVSLIIILVVLVIILLINKKRKQ